MKLKQIFIGLSIIGLLVLANQVSAQTTPIKTKTIVTVARGTVEVQADKGVARVVNTGQQGVATTEGVSVSKIVIPTDSELNVLSTEDKREFLSSQPGVEEANFTGPKKLAYHKQILEEVIRGIYSGDRSISRYFDSKFSFYAVDPAARYTSKHEFFRYLDDWYNKTDTRSASLLDFKPTGSEGEYNFRIEAKISVKPNPQIYAGRRPATGQPATVIFNKEGKISKIIGDLVFLMMNTNNKMIGQRGDMIDGVTQNAPYVAGSYITGTATLRISTTGDSFDIDLNVPRVVNAPT